MITQIAGEVQFVGENSVTVNVSGISYEVFIPTAILRSLEPKLIKNGPVALVTYHYYQTDPSKSIPILIGFANRMEKEFFEKFITVSGVGPKAAVRALSQPIPLIAEAIDGADLKYLKSLPGIGEQRAKEIIAKLQGKMERFGLMKRGSAETPAAETGSNTGGDALQEEALEILIQLQYRKDEAREMIRKAFARNPKLSTSEDILNEVYRQTRSVSSRSKAALRS